MPKTEIVRTSEATITPIRSCDECGMFVRYRVDGAQNPDGAVKALAEGLWASNELRLNFSTDCSGPKDVFPLISLWPPYGDPELSDEGHPEADSLSYDEAFEALREKIDPQVPDEVIIGMLDPTHTLHVKCPCKASTSDN